MDCSWTNFNDLVYRFWCRFLCLLKRKIALMKTYRIVRGRLALSVHVFSSPSSPSYLSPASFSYFCLLAGLLACLLACVFVKSVRAQRTERGRGRAAGAARKPLRMQYLFFVCGWIPPGTYSVELPKQLCFPFFGRSGL